MAESSAFATAVNILASPQEAFAAIRVRPTIWLPLLLLIAGYCAVSMTYLHSVDLAWFMDQQIQAGGGNLTDEQRAEAVNRASQISPLVLGAIGTLTSSIAIVLYLLLYSLYLTGISFATNDGVRLKQWFALLSWCAIPVLLGLLAALANIVFRDARFLPQNELNPLAFGNLLGLDLTGANVFQRILFGLDPTTLWSLVLGVFGYHAWTNRSVFKSAAIVLAPLVIIVAIGVLLTQL
jgi:Yip1 domain